MSKECLPFRAPTCVGASSLKCVFCRHNAVSWGASALHGLPYLALAVRPVRCPLPVLRAAPVTRAASCQGCPALCSLTSPTSPTLSAAPGQLLRWAGRLQPICWVGWAGLLLPRAPAMCTGRCPSSYLSPFSFTVLLTGSAAGFRPGRPVQGLLYSRSTCFFSPPSV